MKMRISSGMKSLALTAVALAAVGQGSGVATAAPSGAGLAAGGANAAAVGASPVPLEAPTLESRRVTQYMAVTARQVCNSEGHVGASFWWYWNPNSWYCYDLSIPAGITFAPAPGFSRYCRSKGYQFAEAWPLNVFGWRCVRFR